MEKKDFSIYEVETHQTKDLVDLHINGELTVIWRNWDKIIASPEMIYVNLVNPGEIKGPHIHKNRTSYFYCIHGKIISVSNGVAAAIVNPTSEISKILVLADVAWRPNDSEMENISFDDYELQKLINNN